VNRHATYPADLKRRRHPRAAARARARLPHPLATATSHFVLAIMAGTGTITYIALGSFSHGHGVAARPPYRSASSPGPNSAPTCPFVSAALSSNGCSLQRSSRSRPDCSIRS